MVYIQSLGSFFVSLVVSGLVIYLVTMFLGSGKGIVTALLTAFVGSVIYALAYVVPTTFLSTLVAGIAWLLAIRHFYNTGWLRAIVMAAAIWFVAGIVSTFLPTLAGPF